MFRHLALLPLALAAAPARAQEAATDVSALIRDAGLAATEAHLAAIAEPTADERFALGGVRFLSGIERAFQMRYRYGMGEGVAVMLNLPVLRVPLGHNPAPEPFDPGAIEELFAGVVADMTAAVDVLQTIDDADAVSVAINLSDLWFDFDSDGIRHPDEGLLEISALFPGAGTGGATIRFDTADAAWLSAYAHLLAGVGETVVAIGPAPSIAAVTAAADTLDAIGGPAVGNGVSGMGPGFDATWIDLAAMVLMALDGTPDATHSRAAHAHFLAMIADNRSFWTRVARERDNEAEWIPNKSQDSALGFVLPPDTGTIWQAVLSDAEKILRGDLLLPFWRIGDGAGVNLARIFADPPSLDPVGLIQGAALVPYIEEGPRARADNLWMFSALMGGDAVFYMVLLN